MNVLPLSGSEVTVICPLCNTVICLHNASPMPEPPGLVVKKGRKIRSVTSGSIPSPLSVMVNFHCLSAMWAYTLMRADGLSWQASCAFFIKLMNTCSICPLSAFQGKGVLGQLKVMRGSANNCFRSSKKSFTWISVFTGGAMRVSFR